MSNTSQHSGRDGDGDGDDVSAGRVSRQVVPPPVDQQVANELAFHVEMRTRELIAAGMSPDDARRRATERFGDFNQVEGVLRQIARKTDSERRRTRYLVELLTDARFALRMLSRRRVFAAIAIGTLALGIGAATSIFSVADGVLLRPLPFPDPDRIVSVWIAQPAYANDPTISWLADATPLGIREYLAIRRNSTTVRGLAMYANYGAVINTPAGLEQVSSMSITSTLLPMLRVRPALGRGFTASEDVLHGPDVVMLSWENWQSRFGGDTSVIGSSVTLNSRSYAIVGVMPPGFRVGRKSDPPAFWVPALRDSSDIIERRKRNYRGIARLADGVSSRAATQEVANILRRATNDTLISARVEQWQRDDNRNARGPLPNLDKKTWSVQDLHSMPSLATCADHT